MAYKKRKDSNRVILKIGETQRKNGTYQYAWTDINRRRHFVYAKTLTELRFKEEEIKKDESDGIKSEGWNLSLNDVFETWIELKRGIKGNTRENYIYQYNTYIRDTFGKRKVVSIKKSDVKRFYNDLVDKNKLQASSINAIHTIMHQIFAIALDDEYIRSNPCDNVLKEFKQSHKFTTEKRRALTLPEQKLFFDYIRKNKDRYYPIFAVMLGTGLRVGELTALRWCDIDFEQGIIHVRNNLICHDHRDSSKEEFESIYEIQTPKTASSIRDVPMLDFVKEAFLLEKKNQKERHIHCFVKINGLTDFIFLTSTGKPLSGTALNKAIKRFIKDCNKKQFEKSKEPKILLPDFSCHTFRHTFATRMCEAGVNIKVIQATLGHGDIETTMNIYTDATKDLKLNEFINFNDQIKDEFKL